MSGIIMSRHPRGISVFTDGCQFVGHADFTVTGIGSKQIRLPHLPAIVGLTGFWPLRLLVEYHHGAQWRDFDGLVSVFRDNVVMEVQRVFEFQPFRGGIGAQFYLGGYSALRGQWETYTIEIETSRDDLVDGVGEVVPAPETTLFPEPSAEALARYGFDPLNIKIDDDAGFVRLMRAMRATPQLMGEIGDDAEKAREATTIGGFIEKSFLNETSVQSHILWRWPDRVGEMINSANEGEAVVP